MFSRFGELENGEPQSEEGAPSLRFYTGLFGMQHLDFKDGTLVTTKTLERREVLEDELTAAKEQLQKFLASFHN
jgi:hypothetical protein